MKLDCPHCSASLELDEETLRTLATLDAFDCPVCEKSIPSPVKTTPTKTGHSVFRSINRNVLILGSTAILVIGGIVTFLATRQPPSTTEVTKKINEKFIYNEFFTRLVESGATTVDDLREIETFAAYGDGFVGLSQAAMTWKEAVAYADRLGGEVLDITVLPHTSRKEMSGWLAKEITFLQGRSVWVADQGLPCGLDAPDILPVADEQGRWRVMVAWPADKTWINLGWRWMIEPNFDEARPFSEWGFAIVRVGKYWGIIDEEGNTILEAKYDEITNFSEHGCARVSLDGKWGLVDRNGKLIAETEWEDIQDLINGFIPVQRNEKWGYLNEKGELVIPCEWGDAWRFSPEGFAVVTRHIQTETQRSVYHPRDGFMRVFYEIKRGIIDRTGKIIVEPNWDGVINFSKEGLGLLRQSGSGWALVNTSGQILHPPTLDLLWRERRWDLGFLPHNDGVIGMNGKSVDIFEEARHAVIVTTEGRFREGLARVDSEKGSGFVDAMGEWVIKPQDFFCRDFQDGFAAATRNGKWGFIDRKGKFVIDTVWDEVRDMEDGKAAVKRDGRWGWVGKDGTIIAQPTWNDVRTFVNGYSAVNRGGKWGFIDLDGKVIAEPQWKDVGDFSDGFASVMLEHTPELLDMVPEQHRREESNYDPATRRYTRLPAHNFFRFIDSTGKIAFDGKIWFRNVLDAKSFSFKDGHIWGKPLGQSYDWMEQWKYYTDTKGNLIEYDWKRHDDYFIFGNLIKHYPGDGGLPYQDRHGLTGPHGRLRDVKGNDILWGIGRDKLYMGGALRSDLLADYVPYSEPAKYGVIDMKGNVIVPPTLDNAYILSADRVIIEVKGKKGLMDGSGKILIEPEWDELSVFSVRSAAFDDDGVSLLFGNGVMNGRQGKRFLSPWVRVSNDGKTQILRTNGLAAIPETMPEAEYVDFYGPEQIVIKEKDENDVELRSLYDPVTGVKTGFPGAVRLHYNWNAAHYGFIWELVEVDSEVVFRLRNLRGQDPGHTQPATEEPVGWGFMQERARLHDGVGWYFIGINGQAISQDRWEDVRDFRAGCAAVKREGKWGFVGLDGAMVTEVVYDEVFDFSEGLAAVKREGRWGYIDPTGEMVIVPVWDEAQSFARWYGGKKQVNDEPAYLAVAEVKANGAAALIDREGGLIVDPRTPKLYRDGSAYINGKEPLIVMEKEGKVELVNPQSEGVPYHLNLDSFSPNLITDRVSSRKNGLNRLDGSRVLEPVFERIEWVAPGVAAAWNQVEGGLVNAEGTWIFKDNAEMRLSRFRPTRGMDTSMYRHGLALIEDTPRWGYIRLNRTRTETESQ